MEMVQAFLQALYCHETSGGDSCGLCPGCNRVAKMIHPDVHYIFPVLKEKAPESYADEWRGLVQGNPRFREADLNAAMDVEGKNTLISVAEANSLLRELSITSLEGGWCSVVIYLPEKMNTEASNRLLKIIEEPPSKTLFIMVTHAPEKMLATIRSRCQMLRVIPDASCGVVGDETGIFAPLMEALVKHDLYSALEIGEKLAALPSRPMARRFCEYASSECRDILLAQKGLTALKTPSGDTLLWASKCRNTFPRMALEALDRAAMLIDRNGNMKIIFTDLVNKLIVKI